MAITTINNRAINRADTAASGQKWTATSATASDFQAGGKILQVKFMQSSSGTTLASTSLTDLPLTNTITPSATSSKILIQFIIQAKLENAEGYGTAIERAIDGGATTVLNEMVNYYCLNWSTGGEFGVPSPYCFEDSPSTVSEITYTVQVKGNTTSAIQVPNGSFNSLTIMEISA